MKQSRAFQSLALTTLTAALSLTASAALITRQYDVFNQGVPASSCGDESYGLFTGAPVFPDRVDTSCWQVFSIDSGTKFTEYDDGTAELTGSATNKHGLSAVFRLELSGKQDTYSPVRTGGSSDTSDWQFYTVLSPDDFFDNFSFWGDDYVVPGNAQLFGAPDHIGTLPVFQFGTGANDKTDTFGGSVWLDGFTTVGDFTGDDHWELNFDLSPIPGAQIPVPAPLGLLVLGIAALRISRCGNCAQTPSANNTPGSRNTLSKSSADSGGRNKNP